MGEEWQIITDYDGDFRKLIWLNLQDDGSISVGFNDRTFLVPCLMSEIEVSGLMHRQRLDLIPGLGPEAIKNPHFTFHPPLYFHLRAPKRSELWAGIMDMSIMMLDAQRIPWLRFITKPLNKLHTYKKNRKEIKIARIRPSNMDCSLYISIDFIALDMQIESGIAFLWKGYKLHMFFSWIPSQNSEIRFLWQG